MNNSENFHVQKVLFIPATRPNNSIHRAITQLMQRKHNVDKIYVQTETIKIQQSTLHISNSNLLNKYTYI